MCVFLICRLYYIPYCYIYIYSVGSVSPLYFHQYQYRLRYNAWDNSGIVGATSPLCFHIWVSCEPKTNILQTPITN